MADLKIDIQVSGADQAEQEFEKVGTAADKAGKEASNASKGFKAIGTAVAGIGLVTSGIFGLVDAADDLAKSDLTVARTGRKASEATEKRQKAEKALADAMKGTTQQMELQIPAGEQFVQMWGDTEIQVRNANGEMRTIPKVYKAAGGSMKSIAELQDDLADAREAETIALERNSLAVNENRKDHERQGIQYAKNAGQIAAGAGMFIPWIESAQNMIDKGPPMAKTLGKVAGAAGLVGAAVGGAVIASEELAAARMADPKFAKQVEKDTKALEKFSLAGAALPQLTKTFGDIGKGVQVAATATFKWAVDNIWPPIQQFIDSLPPEVKDFVYDAVATIQWAVKQIWEFFTVTVPDALKGFAQESVAAISWAVQQVWQFFTVTVPEALKGLVRDSIAAVTWVVQQIWQFFTVTVPEALKGLARDSIAAISWVVQQVWQFFTVTVPDALKGLAHDSVAAITWAVQQVWQFFTITVPEALKGLALNSVAAVTWAVNQVWGFFTITVPDALKGLALNSVAAVKWAVQQTWGLFTVTVPEALKAIAVDAQASVTWAVNQTWEAFTVTIPDGLKKIAIDALATVTWAVHNIWPQGSVLDQVFGGGAKPNLDMKGTVTLSANDQATSTINQVKSSLEGIKDKDATIRVSVTGGATGNLPNIGGLRSRFARTGMSEVISRPTNIRVGEGFQPEMVNVTPLGKHTSTSPGTALHPHAAAGGNFISGIENMVSSVMMGAVKSIAAEVKTESQRVEEEKYQLEFQKWNRLIEEMRSIIRKTADDVVKARKTSAAAAADPKATGSARSAQARALADAEAKYAAATRQYSTLINLKPTPPKVNVDVTAAAKGFGPSIVKRPTLFMAGEKGSEMVSVMPMRRGARAGTGGGGDLGRVLGLLEKFLSGPRTGGGAGGIMQANLIVDGQRMANVSQKYIGTKSYGDR